MNQALILSRRYTHSLPRVVPILCGAGFTIATCAATGLLLLRALRLTFDRAEQLLFGFVSGAALLSTVVFFLCVVHQARTGVFLALGAGAIGAAVPHLPRKLSLRINWLYFSLFAIVFFVYLFNALAPEVSPDGSGYHLGNVIRTYEHHGFAWNYLSIYAAFPQGVEMLFLVAYSIGGMPAAAMVHLAFLCVLAGLLICYGRRFGCPRAGMFAAVLVFASPVIGLVGVSAYNDVALATYIFAGFYSAQVFSDDSNPNVLFLLGIFCGFAFAIKYTGWLLFPYAILLLRGRGLARFQPAAASIALPWAVRNWIWIGNPLAPFFNRWFPNRLYSTDLEASYLADLRHVEGFRHWWEVPLDLTLYGAKLPGFLGPVFLLAPLALLSLRFPLGRKLLAAFVVFSLPFCLNPAARFLIPGIPFLALAMGLAMQNSPGVLPALAGFHVLLSLPPVMPAYCAEWAWRIREVPVRVAMGLRPEEPYVRRFVPDYWLKGPIEKYVSKNQKIFSFSTLPEAYLNRTIIIGYESVEGMKASEDPKRYGINFMVVNDRDFNSAAIKKNANSLRLTALEQRNGTTLYRVD